MIKLTIVKNGVRYILKVCRGCGDEWYAKPKQNRCSLCGSGLQKVLAGDSERRQRAD